MTMATTQIVSSDLHALSIAEASELIRRKALSPVELTQALLDRAALLDPKIHAYLRVTPDLALKQARLVVLRQKTRCLFLVNLLTQYGHLGSVLAIATIKY